MFSQIQKLTMSIALIVLLLTSLESSAGAPSTSQLAPSHSRAIDARNKLIVYLVGFSEQLLPTDTKKNNGYGYEGTFYQPNGIQPFLQNTPEFKNAQSMVFSYPDGYNPDNSLKSFHGDGLPNSFTCDDTSRYSLLGYVLALDSQIKAYLIKNVNTDVYLVGHSLGGVIAFAFTTFILEGANKIATTKTPLDNGGLLKGVSINDSPLGGVTDNGIYSLATLLKVNFKCKLFVGTQVTSDLIAIYKSATDKNNLGESASIESVLNLQESKSNQQVATDAANAGVALIIVGFSTDLLWQPSVCGVNADFLSTEYLSNLGGQGKGALYVRSGMKLVSMTDQGGCAPNPILNSHVAVVTDTDVKQAIWETFTGGVVDTSPIFSTVKDGKGITIVLTPPPVPTATPTPVPTASIHIGDLWTGYDTSVGSYGDGSTTQMTFSITSITPVQYGYYMQGFINGSNPAMQIYEGTSAQISQHGGNNDVIARWGKSPIDRYVLFDIPHFAGGEMIEEANGDLKGIEDRVGFGRTDEYTLTKIVSKATSALTLTTGVWAEPIPDQGAGAGPVVIVISAITGNAFVGSFGFNSSAGGTGMESYTNGVISGKTISFSTSDMQVEGTFSDDGNSFNGSWKHIGPPETGNTITATKVQ